MKNILLMIACCGFFTFKHTIFSSEYESDTETVLEAFSINYPYLDNDTDSYIDATNNQNIDELWQQQDLVTAPYRCPSCITSSMNKLRALCTIPSIAYMENQCVQASDFCDRNLSCCFIEPHSYKPLVSCFKLSCTTLCVPACKTFITPDCVRCVCYTVGCYWLDGQKESK